MATSDLSDIVSFFENIINLTEEAAVFLDNELISTPLLYVSPLDNQKIRFLVDEVCPEAEKIILVMDNLNTHTIGSLYKAYKPAEARRIARKLEVHYTPKHGSWLDIAEIGINIMTRECLNRRIPGIKELRSELQAWNEKYNNDPSPVNWQYTVEKSRVKLARLYPDIEKHIQDRDTHRQKKSEAQQKAN